MSLTNDGAVLLVLADLRRQLDERDRTVAALSAEVERWQQMVQPAVTPAEGADMPLPESPVGPPEPMDDTEPDGTCPVRRCP